MLACVRPVQGFNRLMTLRERESRRTGSREDGGLGPQVGYLDTLDGDVALPSRYSDSLLTKRRK